MARDAPLPPSWIDDRDINYAELVHATEINRTTIVAYQRTLAAAGFDVGKLHRGERHFSCRELYGFHIIAALLRLRVPVTFQVLSDVWTFIADRPTGPFMIIGDGSACIMVQAPMLWTAAIKMMTEVRDAETD